MPSGYSSAPLDAELPLGISVAPMPVGNYNGNLSIHCHVTGCSPDYLCPSYDTAIGVSYTVNEIISGYHAQPNPVFEDFKKSPTHFLASITSPPGKIATWKLNVGALGLASGVGNSVDVPWDFTWPPGQGPVFNPGDYGVTLYVTNNCADSETKKLTIKRHQCDTYDDPNCCKIEATFGSSANVVSGNLYHSQPLFSLPNSKIFGDFTLHYNSLDSYSGPLGLGWTHTYNINLNANSDGSFTVMEADGKRGDLYKNGTFYAPKVASYPVLSKNSDGTFTLMHRDGKVYNFSSVGKITKITDRNGNSTSFTYSGGNLTKIVDTSGRTISLTYNSSNRITKVTDPNNNAYNFTYTGNMLTGVSSPNSTSQGWRYTYDTNGLMLTKTDPNGNVTVYSYDQNNRVITSNDPEGGIRTMDYPAGEGEVFTSSFTEKDGGVWDYTYNVSQGVLLEKTDPDGNSTTYTYDANNNLLSSTDANGSTSTYIYDADRKVTSVTDAAGNTTTYTYNSYGQVTSMTDSQGRQTIYVYDTNGNMTSVTDPSGAITQYGYDTKGNVTSITNADGKNTTFIYDQYNNLSSVTDASGVTTTFTYDAMGNMTGQTDSSGNTTKHEYNGSNQLVKVTDPQGNVSSYTYDLNGNRISSTDGNGNTTLYEYNYNNQVTKVTDALGNKTIYTYGGAGCPSCGGGTDKLTSVTDADGNVTTYQYDTLGRLMKETDPSGNIITYAYDAAGNLVSKTDATGITVNYTYDSLNRLISVQFPDTSQNISYTYDASGKVLTMTDQSGMTSYAYDNAGRVLSETKQMDANSYTTVYAYTAAGVLSSIGYPSGRTIGYGMDASGRVISVAETKDGVTKSVITGITYNSIGAVSSVTAGNGIATSNTYDSKNALSGMNIGNLKKLSYVRDNVGNITSITDLLDPTKTKTYSYDAIYRLTKAIGPWGTIQYAYDPVGNRTTETAGAGTTNYAYNTNKLLSSTGVKPFAFGYDDNGNAISENQRQYLYNQNQRLIKAVEGTNTLGDYVYNGNGQRTKKTVNGKMTYFIYDQSGNLMEEVNGDGNPATDYIYLGSTPIGRVDMNKDIVPPATTVSVGTPNYQNGNSEFISAATPIALTAVDTGYNSSGVDHTEYIIDDGTLWTTYVGPLNLANYDDGMHTIFYRSIDKAGNLEDTKMLTVTLDKTTPASSVTVGSPQYQTADNLYIGNSTLIAITAADSGSGVQKTEYSVDGGEYISYSGQFTLASYQDGQHTIRYRSTDNLSNIEPENTLTISLDSSPPAGTISINNNDAYTKTAAVTLTLFTSDGSGADKMCESDTASCAAWEDYAGTKAWLLPQGDGTKTVYVWYRDKLGNTDTAPYSASITLDTTAPLLTVSTLSDGSWTNNQLLNISGQATDGSGLQLLTINDAVVAMNPDGSFSYPIILQEGSNTISVNAVDLAGNGAVDTRTIDLDRDAPNITIMTPSDNIKTRLSPVDVTGTVDENSTVNVKINDADPIPAQMNGNSFSLTVTPVYGINTIEVTATDLADNTSTAKRTLTFDDRNPSLSITDPSQDIKTDHADMTVKGATADLTAVTASITIDGNTYAPAVTNGTFEQPVTFTAEKTYQIYAKAVDEAGNETTVQRNVVYDITSPAVTIDAVTSPTNLDSQVLTGTMEEGAAVTVTCPTATVGTVTYPASTTWTVPLTNMQEGNNAITVTATDEAGNTSPPVSAAILLNTQKSISNTSPAGLWLGLKNSDDQGTQFDLRAKIYINGILITSGQTLCITGVTRNASLAKEVAVPFNAVTNGVYNPGDILSLKVLTRIGTTPDGQKCSGHSSAVGLRMYYDSADRPSGFGAQVAPDPMKDLFLHSTGTSYYFDTVTPTGIAKYRDSASVNYSSGNPWKEIGTWTMTLQYQGIAKMEGRGAGNYVLSGIKELKPTAPVTSRAYRFKLTYETDARKMDQKVAQTKETVLLASTGSTSGLLNSSTVTDVIYFYHTDHLGTPIMMTDTNGNKVWEGEFLPFGEAYSVSGTVTNNLRFPGQYYDEETGLYYNWHRDYAPEVGRYIEADPIGLKGGINKFSYVSNSPVNFIDPIGLRWDDSDPVFRGPSNPGTGCLCKVKQFFTEWNCNTTFAERWNACKKDFKVSKECFDRAEQEHELCLEAAKKLCE